MQCRQGRRGQALRTAALSVALLAACAANSGGAGGNPPTVSITPTGQGTYRLVVEAEASGPMRLSVRVEPPGSTSGAAVAGATPVEGAVPSSGGVAPAGTPTTYTVV